MASPNNSDPNAGARLKRIAAFGCIVGCSACSSLGPGLKPAPEAHAVAAMDGAVVGADNQIEVIAQTDSWQGDRGILQHVDPIRVRIGNYGSRPLHIRYDHIRLISREGRRFPLVPPLPTYGHVPSPARPTIAPRFRYERYQVAPYYGSVYAAVAVHGGAFLRRVTDAQARAEFRQRGSIPTPEMVAWAIPEGVLGVSGFIDGYLFFERVPETESRVQLQLVLHTVRAPALKPYPTDGSGAAKVEPAYKPQLADVIAHISIPFVVD